MTGPRAAAAGAGRSWSISKENWAGVGGESQLPDWFTGFMGEGDKASGESSLILITEP